MKKIFIISFLIVSWITQSQVLVNGNVFNEDQEPVSFATVTIEHPETKAVIAYDQVDDFGAFKITFTTDSKEVVLRVRAINYREYLLDVANDTQKVQIQLESENTVLEEITVKASLITQDHDTLVFDLNAFAGKNDRVLEDVLKKMPGFQVGLNGEIKYQGTTINKFYVQGKDLMAGGYSAITKALPNMHISKLEVLENHQPIKMLEDKIGSNAPAINIRLKSDISFSGSAKLGAFVDPLLWKADITPMLFTKELQYLFSYNTNNSGDNLSSKGMNFGSFGSFDVLSYGKSYGTQLGLASSLVPRISESRYLFNTSHYASANTLFKVAKDLELKINLSYFNDYLNQEAHQFTEVFTGLGPGTTSGGIQYSRSDHNTFFTEKLNTSFALERNTKKNYLNNILTFSLNRHKDVGDLQLNDNPIGQVLVSPSYSFQNTLSTLIGLRNNRFINFRSLVNINKDKQLYSVGPVSELNIPDSSLKRFSELDQSYENQTFFTQNTLSHSWTLARWTLTQEYSLVYDRNEVSTELYGYGLEKEQLGIEYLNQLKYNRLDNVMSTMLNFKSQSWTFNIKLPVQWKYFLLEESSDKVSNTKNRLVLEPSVWGTYRASNTWSFRANARVVTAFTPLAELLPNFVFSKLNFSSYQNKIESSTAYFSGLNLEYKNPFNGVFFNAGTVLNSTDHSLIYGVEIDQNGQQIIQAVERDHTSKSISGNLNVGTFINNWATQVKASFNLSKNKSQNLINQEFSIISLYTYGSALELTNNYLDWLNVSYKAQYNHFKRMEPLGGTSSYEFQQNFKLDVFPIENHSLVWAVDYLENTFNGQRFSNTFMDLMYRYKWNQKNIDFELGWQNLLNTKEYQEVVINNIQSSTTTFKLRPSQVMLSVRFNF